jgi:hypothetical protein
MTWLGEEATEEAPLSKLRGCKLHPWNLFGNVGSALPERLTPFCVRLYYFHISEV